MKNISEILRKVDDVSTKNSIIFGISFIFFVCITLSMLLSSKPWMDEVIAWNISAFIDLKDLFEIEHSEGHLFVWYLILKPFAKYNLFYPYSMQIINWIIMSTAMFLFWKYSKINDFCKVCFTFSYMPILYTTISRCYGVAVLGLFALATLYPKRIKHPIWYSLLIFFTANTCVVALIGAFAFGLTFLFDLYKAKLENKISNQTIFYSLGIFVACAIIVFLQIAGSSVPSYATRADFGYMERFFRFYCGYDMKHILFMISHSCLFLFAFKFFIKDRKPFAFCFLTSIMLIIMFFNVYGGERWHYGFLFIYLIISVWIYLSENEIKTDFQRFWMIIFMSFNLSLLIFPQDIKAFEVGPYTSNKMEQCLKNPDFEGKKIIFFPCYNRLYEITPFYVNSNIDFYDSFGNSIKSKAAHKIKWTNKAYRNIDLKAIANIMQSGETAYILSTRSDEKYLNVKIRVSKFKKEPFKVEQMANMGAYAVYSITKE